MPTSGSSNIARPPAPQLAGYPVATVTGAAAGLVTRPYLGPAERVTVWLAAQDMQRGMSDGQQLVVCCPECGQLMPWQSQHLLVVCGYCGAESSLPIVAE